MATKLEDFVAKLHADGVESGRIEAERLVEDARRQAESIRHEAEARARDVVAQAGARAELLLQQATTELRLAARDTLLQLHGSLTVALEAIMKRGLAPALLDPAQLSALVREVVVQYASADAQGERRIVFDVPEHLAGPVRDWSLKELGASLSGHESFFDVRGVLSEAGFEYHVRGETVDMTLGAVADVLHELVRPALAELLAEAAAGQGATGRAAGAGAAAADAIAVGAATVGAAAVDTATVNAAAANAAPPPLPAG
jgi:V/A-type H+/Na+-transporting ATPase subunit E